VNSLQSGPGPMFAFHQTDRPAQDVIKLENTTLRNSGGLISLQLLNNRPWQSRLKIEPTQCVFDLSRSGSDSGSQEDAVPLVTFVGTQIIPHWHEAVEIDGSSSVINRKSVLAALQSPDGSITKPLTNATPRVSGIVSSAVQYRGVDIRLFDNSVVSQVEANWRSESLPGIQARESNADLSSNSTPKALK
jgi:hypothetical protein